MNIAPRALLLIATLLATNTAWALDVDTFEPTGSAFEGRGTLQLLSPTIGFPWSSYGGLALYLSDDPLEVIHPDGTSERLVDSILGTRFAAGTNILGKARVDLSVPVYPWVFGSTEPNSGAGMGDIQLQALYPFVNKEELGVAVAPFLRLPSGSDDLYTGSSGVGGGLTGVLGGMLENAWHWNANLAIDLGSKEQFGSLDMGTSMRIGAGLAAPVNDHLQIGAELTSALTTAGGLGPYNKNPTEGHLYGQYKSETGIVFSTGAGTGLVAGLGAPDIRVFGLFSYAWEGIPPVYDRDHDGIIDERDTCPDHPEDIDTYRDEDGCPDLDNDGDGLPDPQDQCPVQAEDFDKFQDEDGCPDPDNDEDRVLDTEDACPLEAGTVAAKGCPDRDNDTVKDTDDACPDEPGPVATKGCPDRDNDRVADFRDKCPDQPADPRIVPELSDGCPSRVFVSANQVVIMDKVFFDTNKDTIKKQSFSLLNDVAKVLNDNKQIKRIEIQGHTDSVGNDSSNLNLSQRRAESVMKYLVMKGKVDPNRLEAKGYGETKPMTTNETDVGRADNRRVEFVILEQ